MAIWPRKLNQSTAFGAFLDPVADKIMVAAALVVIVEHYNTIWVTIPAMTMIGREIIISALREWMAELGKRSSVAVSWIGKWKTMIQMVSLTGLIWQYNVWMVWLAYVMLLCRYRAHLLVDVPVHEGCLGRSDPPRQLVSHPRCKVRFPLI